MDIRIVLQGSSSDLEVIMTAEHVNLAILSSFPNVAIVDRIDGISWF